MEATRGAAAPVDLTNCDREPIHIPGSIQPHGVLLACREGGLEVVQISANSARYLGTAPEGILGRPLAALLGEGRVAELGRALAALEREKHPRLAFTLSPTAERPESLDAIVHRSEGQILLELDASRSREGVDVPTYYRYLRNPLESLTAAPTLDELGRIAARETRDLTGFDRVMIYRFDRDWNGTVVAEERDPALEPFLGLRYPASDIPRQARDLYTRNWLRIIPDVGYQPAPVVPAANPATGRPLDLSHAVLRSVSPMHLAYLKNMGVGASMSISILLGGRLWGLIACHHRTARHITHELRLACEFLGQAFSLRLAALELEEEERYRRGLKARLDGFRDRMDAHPDFLEGLMAGPGLADFGGAHGAALLYEGRFLAIGRTPPEAEVRALAAWLDGRDPETVYATDSLPAEYPPAEGFAEAASGLLALSVPTTDRNYVLWFKPEAVRTVDWAGDPRKPVETGPGGLQLSPRRSFELWKETVRFRSLPWHPHDLETARELKAVIVSAALKRTAAALAESNAELDAFAYVASHDLREPLRGIRSYSGFLAADHAGALGREGLAHLGTIDKLTRRMEDLIHSLFEHSRVGKVALAREKVDLNALVEEVRGGLAHFLAESGAEVVVPRPLPAVECDPTRVGEVLANLIQNGCKYNRQARKRIEIGALAGPAPAQARGGAPVIYVRDNGIGIEARHAEAVFRMFRRLHARDQYGGGSGAGLAIVKRIVERHGGAIWLESEPGMGTTFYFTLSPPAEGAAGGARTSDRG